MDGLKKKRRVSYAVHWSFYTGANTYPASLVFFRIDETMVSKVQEIKAMPNLVDGPLIERLVHTELTSDEKKKLERMLDA